MNLASLFGGGGPNVGAITRRQNDLLNRRNSLAELLLSSYRANAAGGAYDPNAQLDLLRRDTEYGTGLATGNSAAAARTMGYRPGDTAPVQAVKAITDRATLDYDKLAHQIRADAADRNTQALSNAVGGASGIYGDNANLLNGQIQTALQQQAQQGGLFGTLLGAAMPFVAPGAGGAVEGAFLNGRFVKGLKGPDKTNPFYR